MRMSTAKPPSPGQSNCSREVGLNDAGRRFSAYPHQFSGGMRQRIMIAMALAANPGLLLADEPTTALDVVVQAGILGLINGLRRSRKMSLLFVSHDLAVVSRMCDRIAVMYAGSIVEEGPTMQVLHRPRMPYTIGLLNSIPGPQSGSRLAAISGFPPQLETFPQGCTFAPRCRMAIEACSQSAVAMVEVERATGRAASKHRRPARSGRPGPRRRRMLVSRRFLMPEAILSAQGLWKTFGGHGYGGAVLEHAARPHRCIDLPGARQDLGVVGESGSGKTTLARCLSLLIRPDRGSVTLDGEDLTD